MSFWGAQSARIRRLPREIGRSENPPEFPHPESGVVPGRCDRWSHIPNEATLPKSSHVSIRDVAPGRCDRWSHIPNEATHPKSSRVSIGGVVPGRCDRWSHIPKLPLQSAVHFLVIRIFAVLIASKCRPGRLTAPAIPAVPYRPCHTGRDQRTATPILKACGNSDHEQLRMVHRAGLPPLMNLPGTTSLSTFRHCRQRWTSTGEILPNSFASLLMHLI
ncbi:hypothetical protein SCOR_24545 [Sulfidibacter corallicola]